MKVLQINSVCGYGSTGRIVVDLYNTLLDNGHDCVIAYGRENAPDNIKVIKIGSILNNYWNVLITRLFDKHGYGSKRATKKFIKQIKEYNPDIIHLHNIHGYYLNIKILFDYLRVCNKKIIWTLHDCWAFTGHCSYFSCPKCDKWKNECGKCIRKKDYPQSIFMDNSRKEFNFKKKLFTGIENLTIITPSKWLANLVKQSFLKEYDVKVINNGIDLNVFKPTKNDLKKKYNIEDKFIILGIASKWEERKGLKYFVELSKKLDNNYKIILIGIDEKLKKEIPENILTITRTNNVKELVEFYTIADIFVNPTLEDNFPTTNLEALACGTPVITFNTGGSPESINKKCGLVIENKNLYDAIVRLKSKNLEQKECLIKSKEYNKEKKYKEYIEYYKEKVKNENIAN